MPVETRNRNQSLIDYSLESDTFSSASYDVAVDRSQRNLWEAGEQGSKRYKIKSEEPLQRLDLEMLAVEQEVEESKYILELGNDFEEDDFVSYDEKTWMDATGFFRRLAIHAFSCRFFDVKLPSIGPAGHGSIDIFWELADRTLLINFPPGSNQATYYGKKPGSEISGRFDRGSARPELILWLADGTK